MVLTKIVHLVLEREEIIFHVHEVLESLGDERKNISFHNCSHIPDVDIVRVHEQFTFNRVTTTDVIQPDCDVLLTQICYRCLKHQQTLSKDVFEYMFVIVEDGFKLSCVEKHFQPEQWRYWYDGLVFDQNNRSVKFDVLSDAWSSCLPVSSDKCAQEFFSECDHTICHLMTRYYNLTKNDTPNSKGQPGNILTNGDSKTYSDSNFGTNNLDNNVPHISNIVLCSNLEPCKKCINCIFHLLLQNNLERKRTTSQNVHLSTIFVLEDQKQAECFYTLLSKINLDISVMLVHSVMQTHTDDDVILVACKQLYNELPVLTCEHLVVCYCPPTYYLWSLLSVKARKSQQRFFILQQPQQIQDYRDKDEIIRSYSRFSLGNESSREDGKVPKEEELKAPEIINDQTTEPFIEAGFLVNVYKLIINGSASPVGILTQKSLQYVAPFRLCDHNSELDVTLAYSFKCTLSKEENELAILFINELQKQLLKIKASIDSSPVFMYVLLDGHSLAVNTMQAFIQFFQHSTQQMCDQKRHQNLFHKSLHLIDKITQDLSNIELCDGKSNGASSKEMKSNMMQEKVKAFYRSNKDTMFRTIHTQGSLFHLPYLLDSSTHLFAYCAFPDSTKADTYAEYFSEKYGLFIPKDDIMVPVNHFKEKLNCLRDIEYEKRSKRTLLYFPSSLLYSAPFSLQLARHLTLLPSILHKIKQSCNISTLCQRINHFLGDNVFKSFHTCSLKTEPCKSKLLDFREPSFCVHNSKKEPDFMQQGLFVQSLIALSALENDNNEVLELLGDSVLKYIVCVELYFGMDVENEMYLSRRKRQLLTNEHLSKVGLARRIDGLLTYGQFAPKVVTNYNPVRGKKQLKHANVEQGDKVFSDAVEAFLGACFVCLEEQNVYRVMKYFGFEITCLPQFKSSSFTRKVLQPSDEKRFGKRLTLLESSLRYTFNDQELYLRTCCHRSFPSQYQRFLQCVTEDSVLSDDHFNYEKLEFIGDAIVEVLVTREIYARNHQLSVAYDSGTLTHIRMALVNTYTLAVLAMQLHLHKHLLVGSRSVRNAVRNWLLAMQTCHQPFTETPFTCCVTFEDSDKWTEVAKAMADIFEAVVGAVYIDSNACLDVVWKVFKPIFTPVIDHYFEKLGLSLIQYLSEAYPDLLFEKGDSLVTGQHCWQAKYKDHMITACARTCRLAKTITAQKIYEFIKTQQSYDTSI